MSLDAQGWRDFDHLYLPPGHADLPLPRRPPDGDGVIRRGMWEGDGPALQAAAAARRSSRSPPWTPRPDGVARGDARAHRDERAARARPASRPPIPQGALDTARGARRSGWRSTKASRKNARAELDLAVTAISTGATLAADARRVVHGARRRHPGAARATCSSSPTARRAATRRPSCTRRRTRCPSSGA